MFSNYLLIAIKIILFITVITPLIITNQTVTPFILGKTFFFRVLVELTLILFLIFILFEFNKSRKEKLPIINRSSITTHYLLLTTHLLKDPLFLSLVAFLVSLIASAIFTATPYRAFWGNIERGEGLWGMLHFFVFSGIAFVIFNKKNWQTYFKLSLIVGIIIVSIGILQFKHFINFSFLTDPSDGLRPGSFIGNAALFAAYISILLILSVFIFFNSRNAKICELKKEQRGISKFWRGISIIFFLIAVTAIFISGTRGGMIGIGAGMLSILFFSLLFFSKEKKISIYGKALPIKNIAVGLIILFISFGVIFWTTRENVFWRNIPGLERLVKTDLGGSARTRIFAWQIAFEAFKEKPIFGWGLEHFVTAYGAHYNPLEPTKGNSTWLDRAHNRFFDILATQGIFGLLSYLAVLVSVFYLLFKNYSKKIAIFASGAFMAYIVQNFFVFDDLNTYIPFFAFLSFLLSESMNKPEQPQNNTIPNSKFKIQNSKFLLLFIQSVIVMVIVIVGYSIYTYNYVPYTQSKYARLVITAVRDDEKEMPLLERAFYPYNFAQSFFRSYIIDTRYINNEFIFEESRFREQATFLEKSLNEIITNEPQNDVRWYIRKNQISTVIARRDEQYYKIAEIAARDGLKFAPKRQELYYALTFALAGQNSFKEAIETAKSALKLNPETARSHYYLALAYALASEQNNLAEEISWFEKNDPYLEQLTRNDKAGMLINYSIAKRDDKIAELVIGLIERRWDLRIDNNEPYLTAFRYFVIVRDSQSAVIIAKFLIDNSIIAVDDVFAFVDAIKNGRWEFIEEDVSEQKLLPVSKKQDIKSPSHETLLQSLKGYITNRDKESALKTARELMILFPKTTDDMEIIIDLVNKEEWEILEKL